MARAAENSGQGRGKRRRQGKAGGKPAVSPMRRRLRRIRRRVRRAFLWLIGGWLAVVLAYTVVPPIFTPYMVKEWARIGNLQRDWEPMNDIAPVMARSVVAAEDANFCLHWGLDLEAIRTAVDQGKGRGASTISQQTVKNVFLWQGRSWFRKALEATMTPVVELIWTKRRLLEVYLNVAEFDEGVFGVQAAAQHYYGVDAADLSPAQAARLAAILPDPKGRSAADPSGFVRQQAGRILDGAATIEADGRAACFQRSSGD